MNFSTSHIYLFQWTELSRIEFESRIGFQALRKLIKNQEESLINTRRGFQESVKYDEELEALPPEERGSYYSQIFEIEERLIDELERQQRYSSCQWIFAFFEGQLESLCNLIEKSFSFKIKLSDLNKHEHLMHYWNFINKVAEFDTQKSEPFFTPIKQHKFIRNGITHQNGFVAEKIKNSIANTTGINFSEFGGKYRINIIDSSYFIHLIEKMEMLLKNLFLLADKKYQVKS